MRGRPETPLSLCALFVGAKFYLFFSSFRTKRLPLHCFSDPLYTKTDSRERGKEGLTTAVVSPRRPPDLADLCSSTWTTQDHDLFNHHFSCFWEDENADLKLLIPWYRIRLPSKSNRRNRLNRTARELTQADPKIY